MLRVVVPSARLVERGDLHSVPVLSSIALPALWTLSTAGVETFECQCAIPALNTKRRVDLSAFTAVPVALPRNTAGTKSGMTC